jgi:hypothetical protein
MRVNDMGDAADTMASFLYYVRYLLITRVHTAIHLYWTDWSYRREESSFCYAGGGMPSGHCFFSRSANGSVELQDKSTM